MTTANNKLSSVEMWRNEDSIRRRIINKMAARQQALTSKEQQQKQQQQQQNRPLVRASGTITTHQKSTVAVTREEGSRILPNGRPPPTEEDRNNSDSGYNKHQRHLLPNDNDVHGGGDSLDYRQSLLKLQYMRSHQAKLHHVMHQPNYDDDVAADGETRLTSLTSQHRLHLAADKSGAGRQSTNAIISRDAQKSSNRMLSVLRASESRRQQHEQLADEDQRRLAQHQQRPYAYDVTSPPVMTSPLTISYPLSLLQRNYSPPPVPPNSSRSRTERLQGNHHHDNDSPSPSSLLVVYLPSVDYPDDNVAPPTPALVAEACNDNDDTLT